MSRRLFGTVWLGALVWLVVPGLVRAQNTSPRDVKAEALALAARIDQLIEARWKGMEVKTTPKTDDAEFWRRVNLDLNGRIPSLTDMRDFLDDEAADKRVVWVEKLLERPEFAEHFANVLRAHMLSGGNMMQAQFQQPAFENWLKLRLQNNTGYDKIVHELLTGQGNFGGGNQQASTAAFYTANENKPENLAGSTSRIFLGVKLECAQCHSHPFAKWTRNQFWEYAAFFGGSQGGGRGFNGNVPDARQIKIPGTDKVVQAKFLNGIDPDFKGQNSRVVLANWMTAKDNPFFARAAVDQVWSYFMGVSLLEPIDEPNDDSPPTHPELFKELTRQFIDHDFDWKFLARAIVHTKAYQRKSSTTGPVNKDDVYLFARMPVRGLSPEQFFDSLAEATDYKQDTQQPFQQQQFFNGPTTPRREFLTRFTTQDKRMETQTSILQALFVMNGKFLADRTKLENNKSLFTIATAMGTATKKIDTAQRVETLYLLVLSRLPRPEESERLVRFVDAGGATNDPRQALADVYWVLLNSAEFVLNH